MDLREAVVVGSCSNDLLCVFGYVMTASWGFLMIYLNNVMGKLYVFMIFMCYLSLVVSIFGCSNDVHFVDVWYFGWVVVVYGVFDLCCTIQPDGDFC